MPLIQRNLFPRRPPKAKVDGPSVLRPMATNNSSNSNSSTMKSSKQQQIDQIVTRLSTNQSHNTTNHMKPKIQAEIFGEKKYSGNLKHHKMMSTSLNSLMVIGNNNNNNSGNGKGTRQQQKQLKNNPKTNGKITNSGGGGSHDSFHSSMDSSSDPSHSLSSSCGSVDKIMISRRKILSRSRDALQTIPIASSSGTNSDDYSDSFESPNDNGKMPPPSSSSTSPEQDVWYNKDKLISDHVEEIITKWEAIDDEIWAKVICMERNRRVAKAYARAPILTVNGCEIGFDGHRIGLNGFANPRRDSKVLAAKSVVDAGIKIRMDSNGNLLVKRLSSGDVFLFECTDSGIQLEAKQSALLFDMKRFQSDLYREVRSTNPNTRILQQRCFCFLAFGSRATELLNTPLWLIVINLVALEMLLKTLPCKLLDDHFYSLPLSTMVGRSLEPSPVPPKLPPRDLHNKKPPLTLPEPDYEEDDDHGSIMFGTRSFDDMADLLYNRNRNHQQLKERSYIDDDPYFCGLSAHVPHFSGPSPQQQQEQQQQKSSRSNPPIVRKKFWSQSSGQFKQLFNGANLISSSSSGSSDSSRDRHMRSKSHTLDNRSTLTSSAYHSSSYHNLSNAQQFQQQYYPFPQPPTLKNRRSQQLYLLQHQMPQTFQYSNARYYNDNNEIYGVPKSNPHQQPGTATHPKLYQYKQQSISSPSLKNIFNRNGNINSTKVKSKDVNNNNKIR